MKRFITLVCSAIASAIQKFPAFPEYRLKQTIILLIPINKMGNMFLGAVLLMTALATSGQPYPSLTFNNATLYSGTDLMQNAVYKFPNAATGVDAFVKIDSLLNGATLSTIDQFGGVGYDAAFQPIVNSVAPSPDSYVKFTIDFKTTGGSPYSFPALALTGLDIDGTTLNLLEYCAIDMGYGCIAQYQYTSPEISVTRLGTGFKALNIAGNNVSGIDSNRKEVMFTVRHGAVSSLTILFGNVRTSGSGNRNYAAFFADFTYPDPKILPLELISFNALVNNATVNLSWITDQVKNSNHFEVERSFDMNGFKTIGLVLDGFEHMGSNGKNYQYKDNSSELSDKTIAYYRLKQFDDNGKITFSKILPVRLQEKVAITMQVFPNPFVENLNAGFTSANKGTAQISISNLAGQPVVSNQSAINTGYNTIQLKGLGGLSKGIYFARLIINGEIIAIQKIIKG